MNAVQTSVWNRWFNSLDWPNPSIYFVFWFKYLCNKAVGFTTHLAMHTGWPSLGLLPLLTHHNLYQLFALSVLTQGPWFFIFQIDGIYRQRRLVADITAIDTRDRQVRWRNDIFDHKNSMFNAFILAIVQHTRYQLLAGTCWSGWTATQQFINQFLLQTMLSLLRRNTRDGGKDGLKNWYTNDSPSVSKHLEKSIKLAVLINREEWHEWRQC